MRVSWSLPCLHVFLHPSPSLQEWTKRFMTDESPSPLLLLVWSVAVVFDFTSSALQQLHALSAALVAAVAVHNIATAHVHDHFSFKGMLECMLCFVPFLVSNIFTMLYNTSLSSKWRTNVPLSSICGAKWCSTFCSNSVRFSGPTTWRGRVRYFSIYVLAR